VAQGSGRVWRIGVLSSRKAFTNLDADYWGELVRGMQALGYADGKNLQLEWRFADGHYERFPEMATDLVRLPVDVIVTDGTPPTRAAQKATATIPIVFTTVADPVGSGIVQSLAKPGGNITGISVNSTEWIMKDLEMLRVVAPKALRVAVLLNPKNEGSAGVLASVRAAARALKVEILAAEVRDAQEIEHAFMRMTGAGAGAFILTREAFLTQNRQLIIDLAARYRLPGIAGVPDYADLGGLMSYGVSSTQTYGRAAAYVDKILKGARPADLPVEQPTMYELFLNRRTAKALGLTIPPELLVQADRVIE
jgi:putative ABC transport system substrate-binding protein